MNLRLNIFRSIAILMLCILSGDLAYSAVTPKIEKASIFLCDSESEESAEEGVTELTPQLESTIHLIFLSPESSKETLTTNPSDKANFSPHGWKVPIFIDDCVYRL